MDSVAAQLDQPFEIALQSRALSGYQWRPVFDETELRLLGKRRTSGAKRFGSAGKEVFRFKANRPGDYHISFELARPFEGASVERRDIALHIQGAVE